MAAACLILGCNALGAQETAPTAQGDSLPERWDLETCINYALEHNISIRRNRISAQSSAEDVKMAKAEWLPALSGSVSQRIVNRPNTNNGTIISGDNITTSQSATSYNGSYGLDANWTLFNGGSRVNGIRQQKLNERIARLAVSESENSIQESLMQLYVQILYADEAVKVNEQTLEVSRATCERGRQLMEAGSLSRADLAQLEAQVSSGQYDVVSVRTQIADSKVQLAQLLELAPGTPFDVDSAALDETALTAPLPDRLDVYADALAQRPEIKSGQLSVERSALAVKTARAAYMPTVSLTAGLGDSHMTGTSNDFFSQMKNNFNANLGLSLSIPIFDNRQTKSAVERAEISELTARLDLQDVQKQLYSSIETYWQNATNSRAKYEAAQANVASLQKSYELVSEQFRLGLTNIAELLTSRGNLLTARQELLQDKYTALLNTALLNFYRGEVIAL